MPNSTPTATAAGKSLEDFSILDTNNDGFATADEVLRYMMRIQAAKSAAKKQP